MNKTKIKVNLEFGIIDADCIHNVLLNTKRNNYKNRNKIVESLINLLYHVIYI